MPDPATLAIVLLVFLIAGATKGVVGMGLPSVSLALLTMAIDLQSAMALLIAPSLATNLWQALVGGHGRAILRRLWPFLLMATATVSIGAIALTRVAPTSLSGLLGLLLIIYAISGLIGWRLKIDERHERLAGLVLGGFNGVFTGMTGSFVFPGLLFLQGIGLTRDQLVQAMGMLFSVSTIALGIALQRNSWLDGSLGLMSALAIIPAVAGMMLGASLRRRISDSLFTRLFFAALLVLGATLVLGAARHTG